MIIYGRNAVLEAIAAKKNIDTIYIQTNIEGAGKKVYAQAKKLGIRINSVPKNSLDKRAGSTAHQGVVAVIEDFEYTLLDKLLDSINTKGEGLIVVLDGIEDPHNLGAIIRSAEGVGADGIIISKNRAAQVNDTVAKTSAGALSHMKIARGGVPTMIEELKKNNFWIYGLDMAGDNYKNKRASGKTALVVGAEGKGLSRLVKEKCDYLVNIPMRGKVGSLNASVAAAIVMFEMVD